MSISAEKIVALAEHFGKDFAEEIAESFDENGGRWSSWGTTGAFEADSEEWNYIENEEQAISIAEDYVKEMLENEPEMFNQDWLNSYLYMSDADRRMYAVDEANSRMEDVRYEMERGGDEYYNDILGVPEEHKDDPSEWDELEDALENYEEKIYREVYDELEDPVQYFVHDQGMYSMEELVRSNIVSINIDDATEDAVSTDGWAHFLSSYDGNYQTIPIDGYDDLVIFRE